MQHGPIVITEAAALTTTGSGRMMTSTGERTNIVVIDRGGAHGEKGGCEKRRN